MARKALVIDDESGIASILSMFLASWGYDVAMFSDALSCVTSLPCTDTCVFDQPCAHAIITDLWMPGMTGLDLMELLRARNCKMPRLAIMSADGREFLPRMAGAGCAFFEKPFELSDLLSWLGQEGVRSDGRNGHGSEPFRYSAQSEPIA